MGPKPLHRKRAVSWQDQLVIGHREDRIAPSAFDLLLQEYDGRSPRGPIVREVAEELLDHRVGPVPGVVDSCNLPLDRVRGQKDLGAGEQQDHAP